MALQPDGSPSRPYATIAEAIEAAPPGALVQLAEGDYQETLVLSRPVVLCGRGPARTHLTAGPRSRWPQDPELPVVTLRSPGPVELRGFSIDGGAVAVQIEGGRGHLLHNLALRRQYLTALRARGGETIMASSEILETGLGKLGLGIEARSATLELHDVVFRLAGRRALELRNTRAVLENLDVEGSATTGVQALDGSDVLVRGGRFVNLPGAALYAGAAHLRVEGGSFRGNEFAVMGNRGAEIEIVGGDLLDHRVAAVALVNSTGSVRGVHIERGGTEAGISVLQSSAPVILEDNRLIDPGSMGLHLTHAVVEARRNTISGAAVDRQGDFGDAIYAIESDLLLEDNALSGNGGSGLSVLRSSARLNRNRVSGNGRAGLWLADHSNARAIDNFFESNSSGVALQERSSAELGGNRFGDNRLFAIDAECGAASFTELLNGNTFLLGPRVRACP